MSLSSKKYASKRDSIFVRERFRVAILVPVISTGNRCKKARLSSGSVSVKVTYRRESKVKY